ncbi:MAG: translation elongation factor Ts [Candidatus Eisenbacteria sp.]|nr:translation elongation factor Ts [Candidatus Eisenbacteria bacterium]
MEISAAQVKALRVKTGAGMMDCKKALAQCKGDMEAAGEYLRKTGQDAALERGGRTAAEGLVDACLLADAGLGVLVEVNSETDFVARTGEFQTFVKDLANQIAGVESLGQGVAVAKKDCVVDANGQARTLGEIATEKSAGFGENIVIRRFARFRKAETAVLEAYIHPGGRVGVLLEVDCDSDPARETEDFGVLVRDVAMQIAAASPLVVQRDEVDQELIEKERRINREIAIEEKKPENVIDKIVEGRLQKFYKEVVLLEQEFVKDQGAKNKRSIQALLKEKSGELGGDIAIRRFARFQLGDLSEETPPESQAT